jgi:hypothetical protein
MRVVSLSGKLGAATLAVLLGGAAIARDGAVPEGRWVADLPSQPGCSPSRLSIEVSGGLIVGNVVNDEGVFGVAGEVDASGEGTIRIAAVGGVIRFGRNRFIAQYPNFRCGMRRAVGVRVS